jgi:flagellar motor switch protein FliN/FliY
VESDHSSAAQSDQIPGQDSADAPHDADDGLEDEQGVPVKAPEFAPVQDSGRREDGVRLDRFLDVSVTLSAELGRVAIPIGELLQLGEGSVLKLGRSVSEPVDLVAQGVRLGRGEVVVVNDCFAIRIKEIESPRNRGASE